MSNFFRRKKKDDEEGVHAHAIPFSTMARWFLYDTHLIDESLNLDVEIGLTPISPEGKEKERQDSDDRLLKVANLYPLIDAISESAARAMTIIHLELLEDQLENLNEKEREEQQMKFHSNFKAVASASILGAFSVGLDLKMIENSTVTSSLEERTQGEDI